MRTWRYFLLFACSAGCASTPAAAPVLEPAAAGAPASRAAAASDAEAVIRTALAEQADAWNRHDARAWVEPFTEDAEFVNILGMLMQGKAEIERRHSEIFSSIFARSRVVVTTRTVRLLGATAALAETDYELRDYDRLPPGIPPSDPDGTLRTRLKYVWLLTSDGWRVVSAQNTAVLPLPRPPRATDASPP